MDTEIVQGGNSLRQQSLSARLINRRSSGVDNNGTKSSLICRDRCGDPRRPRSNDDDVGVRSHEKSMCCDYRMLACEVKLSYYGIRNDATCTCAGKLFL